MESAAQECAATTMHHRRSRPQLLLILAGPPLPYTQRLKTDLKLKWSICNTSFLPIHPQGTESFHKNHIKHPTYALTSPYWFLIPHCTHALKRKFLPAPFSFYVLFLPGKPVSLQSHLLLLVTGAARSLLPFSHNIKQIPCADPPGCPGDYEGSDSCHLKLTLAKVIQQQQSDRQIHILCRGNLSVALKPQPSQSPKHTGWVLKDAEHFLISLTWWDLGDLSQSNADLSPQHWEWRTSSGFFFPMNF